MCCNLYAAINNGVNIMGAINNVSLSFPSFPLLTQIDNINDDTFCDDHSLPRDCIDKNQCPCTHRLKIELNELVEFIIVDETKGKHKTKKKRIPFTIQYIRC